MTKTETFVPVPLMGTGTTLNKGAFDWTYEKLGVLANGSEIFIVDTESLEIVQVLTGHKSCVTQVLWLPSGRQYASAESKLSNRDVISVDSNNHVIVWDALNGQPVYSFIHPDSSRQVLDMRIPNGTDLWMRTKVYILYSGNVLVIFDHAHCSYQNIPISNPTLDALGTPDHLIRVCTDPHIANQAANCIAFLSWDHVANTISSVSICTYWDYGKDTKILINNRIPLLDGKGPVAPTTTSAFGNNSVGITRSTSGGNLSPSVLNNNMDNSKRQMTSSSSIRKLVSDIIVGPDYSNLVHTPAQYNGSISFHSGIKDSLVVSNDMMICLVNIQFMVVLHTFTLDKLGTNSPMAQVIPTKLRPCLLTLHENGMVFLRKYVISGTHNVGVQLEAISCNENPRFSGKKTEVFACAMNPFDENSIIIYLNDGRLLKYDILGGINSHAKVETKKHLTTPLTPFVRNIAGFDEQPGVDHNINTSPKQQSTSPIKRPLKNLVKPILHSELDTTVKIKLTRLTNAFGQFTCLKSQADLLVAGTSTGFVVVMKIVNHRLKALKKFTTHSSSPVSGIEFVSDSEILTYSNLSFSANPKCELVLTEIWTGASKALKMDDNFHIQAIRVSPLGQYFVIVYKNGMGPCELWDLPRRQLIKTLPTKLPAITCIHWRQPAENTKEEVFYMTDLGTFLFTFRVEGNRFLNATCVKLEHTAHVPGIPMALFSRNSFVFRADSNSVLVMYNTVKKTASPSICIGRGPLLGIVRVPGEGDNYVVQFSDSLVLWESVGLKKVKTLNPKLKTVSIAVLNDWVAYIPKGTNGIRLLPLEVNSDVVVKPPAISHISYPYFMNSSEKASKILQLCEESHINLKDLLRLNRDVGSIEEYNFWCVVGAKLKLSDPHPGIDVFCDNQVYKDILVKTAQCVWTVDYRKREEVGKVLLWTGESEKAAEILLDTEPSDSKSYVLNGLKASIAVGSNALPEQTKAVLKIVATNLIACGDTDGGLELLCLLQKHNEACKYVESTNEWGKAILLCKSALNEKNSEDSLCKYAHFMNSKKCQLKAASVYAYVGKFDRTIEVLFGARLRHLSYVLLTFCEKQGVTLSISDHIKTAIRLDFARFIFECGLQQQAIQFCENMSENGKDLKQELEILSS